MFRTISTTRQLLRTHNFNKQFYNYCSEKVVLASKLLDEGVVQAKSTKPADSTLKHIADDGDCECICESKPTDPSCEELIKMEQILEEHRQFSKHLVPVP